MPLSRRKGNALKTSTTEEAPPQQQRRSSSKAASSSSVPDFMNVGQEAEAAVNRQQEEFDNRKYVSNFFITNSEVNANNGRATAKVHLAFNYADDDFMITVPRVTIPAGNGRYDSHTSAGNDCAFVQGGHHPSVKPFFWLIDHRSYTNKKNETVQNTIKLWEAPPAILGQMKQAIEDLAENLGKDVSEIDVRDYELKITKNGTGRGSSWALAFAVKEVAFRDDWFDTLTKQFDQADKEDFPTEAEYLDYMRDLLKPEDKFRLSKNGGRAIPKASKTPQGGQSEASETPY